MSEQKYFKHALKKFTFDVASKGAICHLSDRGFTVDQIMKNLDFPTPYDCVQQTVWEHFLDTGVILLKEPGQEGLQEIYAYVTDYDAYGRSSFRRVTVSATSTKAICWKELKCGRLDYSRLEELCAANGEEMCYVSCDFGLRSRREPEQFLKDVQGLEADEREYVLGLPWERKPVYHRLDQRMRNIVARLYGQVFFTEPVILLEQEKS